MMPGLRVQLCSAPKQLRTGEPLIKKQTNLIQRRKTYVNHGICICAGRNRHGSGQPANGRNHGGEARERCSGHGNTHSEPNGPAGAAGFPCGNDHIPIGQRTKIMLLSKVKVGISACGIGILDGKMFRIISARLKSTNSHRRMMSRALPKSCINMHLNTFRRSISLFAAIRTTNRLCTL